MAADLTLTPTPESNNVLNRIAALAVIAPGACRKALRQIIGHQLRDTIAAWRKTATPGGAQWAKNSPAVEEFKRVVLGQNPVQIGVVTGALRQSISSDVNDAALEGRVGSPTKYAPDFAARRRFLPEVEYAERQADQITERILADEIRKIGIKPDKALGRLGL
jgi:hypothetical protein